MIDGTILPPVPKARPVTRAPSAAKQRLTALAELLIAGALEGGAIVEGVVTSMHRPPYRRLDCDRRALAYVRVRPKKNQIRIDITGLWLGERAPRLRVPSASGTIALAARDEAEVAELVEYLKDTVQRTRAAFAAAKRR